MKKSFVVITFAVLASLFILAACGGAAAPKPTDPLVSIHAEGGLCVYGGCSRDTLILQDGSYTIKDGSGQDISGTLDAATLDALKQAIASADFEEINSKPFTGTCPIAFDGQEFTYTFHKADGSTEVLDSCKVELDENNVLFRTDYGAEVAP